MELIEVIKVERIKLDMEAVTKEEALEELTELLFDSGALSEKESFLEDVYLRESEGLTGIGNGIAIPHGKSKFVRHTSVAFGRTKKEIQWETIDGKPVRFIILFAVEEADKTSTHLRMLSKLAGKLADEDVCKKLVEASSPQEVLEVFSK
jgi:fructose-specific phosphotransferase system IIA component